MGRPTTGGTIVVVAGENLFPSLEAMCRFGAEGYEVLARYTRASVYECTSPSHPPGEIFLEVSANGQQFSRSNATYEFYSPVTITGITPHRGASEASGEG